MWVRNLWVLIIDFAAGLIWNLGQEADFLPQLFNLHNAKYSWTLQRQLVSFYFWVHSALPCQSGCNGPTESSAEMEWNGQHSREKCCLSFYLFTTAACCLCRAMASAAPTNWEISFSLHSPGLSSLQSHKYNDLKYDCYKLKYQTTTSSKLA